MRMYVCAALMVFVNVGYWMYYLQCHSVPWGFVRTSCPVCVVVAAAVYKLVPVLFARNEEYPAPREDMGRILLYGNYRDKLRKLMLNRNALNRYTGKCVSVYGGWGSGKTHFLNYLKYSLTRKSVPQDGSFSGCFSVAHVDLWVCHTHEEAWNQIVTSLGRAINGSGTGSRGLFSLLADVLYAVYPFGNRKTLDMLAQVVFNEKLADPSKSIRALAEKIGFPSSEKAVLLVIDDVERAKREVVDNLLPILNRLRQIPGLLVVCAVSKKELADRLGEHRTSDHVFQGYLEKLFDMDINLPELTAERSYAIFRRQAERVLDANSHALAYVSRYTLFFESPRRMKLALEALERVETYFMAPDSGGQNEFIHKPSSKGSNYALIFTMELMKLFYDSQLRAFLNGKCLSRLLQLREKHELSFLAPGGENNFLQVKQACAFIRAAVSDPDEEGLFPFLEETDENTWLLDSLLANLIILAPIDVSYDSYISSYATSSYLTKNEGDSLIEYYRSEAVNRPLELVIPEFVGREFHAAELADAVRNLIHYAFSRIRKKADDGTLVFIRKVLPELCMQNRRELFCYWTQLLNLHYDNARDNTCRDSVRMIGEAIFNNCPLEDLHALLQDEHYKQMERRRNPADGRGAHRARSNRPRVRWDSVWETPLSVFATRAAAGYCRKILSQDDIVMEALRDHRVKDAVFRELQDIQYAEGDSKRKYYFVCNTLMVGATYILPLGLVLMLQQFLQDVRAYLKSEADEFIPLFERYAPSMFELHPNCRSSFVRVHKFIELYKAQQG